MPVQIKLPTPLRRHTDQNKFVDVESGTVAEVLRQLVAAHEGIGGALYGDDGALKPFVRFFVDGRDIDDMDGVETPLADGSVLTIMPPVAGA